MLLGFAIRVNTSYLQVGRYGGRYILRDGYHRAYGFLRKGISRTPAFVREYASFAEFLPAAGMLPQEAYLGDRPPLLKDFLDDSVATDVELPATEKMVIVHGMEITPLL